MSRLDNLDVDLNRWQTNAAAVLTNILDLYELPTYRLLAGKSTADPYPLSGHSKAEVEKALSAVSELLTLASLLNSTIEKAVQLRSSMPMLFQMERIVEIENLLYSASISLPPVECLPLAGRNLLDGTDGAPRVVTPEAALAIMKPTFEFARDTISEVARAWGTSTAEIPAFQAEIAALEYVARSLGNKAAGATQEALRKLNESARDTAAALRSDPLGAAESFHNVLVPQLVPLKEALDEICAAREKALSEMTDARLFLQTLVEVHLEAYQAGVDCGRKIAIDPVPPGTVDEATYRALIDWLDRLAPQIENSTDWCSARIGLQQWKVQAEAALAADRAALRAAESLLRERLSLRGLLDALQAKAQGCGFGEDLNLAAAFARAKAPLYSRPTPLVEARARVLQYQNTINSRLEQS